MKYIQILRKVLPVNSEVLVQNVAKYQKKKITKLKIINLIKSEISFIFSLAKSKTGNNIYTEMTNMFCI